MRSVCVFHIEVSREADGTLPRCYRYLRSLSACQLKVYFTFSRYFFSRSFAASSIISFT